MAEALERAMHVYVIGAEVGPVKIGLSWNPEMRLSELQTGNPYPLKIFGTIPVKNHLSAEVERRVHAIFAKCRMSGEWFSCSPDAALRSIGIVAVELGAAEVSKASKENPLVAKLKQEVRVLEERVRELESSLEKAANWCAPVPAPSQVICTSCAGGIGNGQKQREARPKPDKGVQLLVSGGNRTRMLRFPQVRERVGYSRMHIHRLEKAGRFPKRVQLGPNSVAWYEHEVEGWLRSRPEVPSVRVSSC